MSRHIKDVFNSNYRHEKMMAVCLGMQSRTGKKSPMQRLETSALREPQLLRKISLFTFPSIPKEILAIATGNATFLLQHVINAKQTLANNFLTNLSRINPRYGQIAIMKCAAIEKCGRKWQAISPIEYAAWAGDIFMLKMLLSHLPLEYTAIAISQLQGIKEDQNNEHGKYLSPLIQLLIAFATNTRLDIHWIKTIGSAQRLLPTYALQEYCNIGTFNHESKFDSPPERSGLLDLHGKIKLNILRLGITCVLLPGEHPWSTVRVIDQSFSRSNWDKECLTVKRLYDTRIRDIDEIMLELQQKTQPNMRITSLRCA